jgi:putative protease
MDWNLANRPEMRVVVTSKEHLTFANNRSIGLEQLRAQLSRLGNTPYELGEVQLETDDRAFLPISTLNRMRREAVEALQALQSRPVAGRVRDAYAQLMHLIERPSETEVASNEAALHVLVRMPSQLEAALLLRPQSITLDYLDLYGLRKSVEQVKSAGITVRVASPRVLKPGEARISDFLASLDCWILVRCAGLLEALREKAAGRLIGDFSLNVANSISAWAILRQGVERITPTHDLNAAQIAHLASAIGPQRIEAVAYQHLPVFHTEHCVFCRFLSKGTSYKDCGRPCEAHQVSLRDERGRVHPVMADVGCRNTVFGAEAQEASTHLKLWLEAGIRDLRLEFVHETGEQLTEVATAFERSLRGCMTFSELGAGLRSKSPTGTTEGSLFIAKDYAALPVLQ